MTKKCVKNVHDGIGTTCLASPDEVNCLSEVRRQEHAVETVQLRGRCVVVENKGGVGLFKGEQGRCD